jgi:hypothetical protein
LTRSHHKSPAIHIADDPISIKRSWCNLIQNVYRRSLSSGPERWKPKFPTIRDPQGLRRPRFSFFIFTCQTARVRGGPSPSSEGAFSKTHSTANHNRQVPVVDSLIKMRSFKGHESLPWLRANAAPRSVGRVIGPPNRSCQRSLSINRRIVWDIFAVRRSLDILRTSRRT